ncbi:MAG: pyruvate:ferredoxin (flavodoxin) oxidoreductase [Elusimicrobia bacterium]|nr:pyruvate:ferredoxin (flavodoxin) oxidoreductase [Elusimicrobiota bacterium]MDE2425169.1 pyruvate:ferredoxin (flavodoxin) oxidoreductase [Elusimicrobiota bacterium]
MSESIIVDGNEAAASVAYRASEVVAIYPITPASPMAEHCDEWAAQGKANLWGSVPRVVEMQAEGGAAGTLHGALQAGALATTFTASQGLLLMIPDMYKIAGELTAACMHVAARTVATHALSIFADHSDVMACRQTGWALLCSGSPQEAQDLALIAHAATLTSRVPFLHFFDGFRTSHEVATVSPLSDGELRSMLDASAIADHRRRGLTPDRPVLRGSAQNPDVFFQAREACGPFYDRCPGLVEEAMERFARLTGRRYRLFEYFGHPQAERVIAVMGSAAHAVREAVEALNAGGQRVGLLTVRLLRPFSLEAFGAALPKSVRRLAVLDRTKEPGGVAEPLFLELSAALRELGREALLIGGRYGLSSKEFTPAMAKAVFDELERPAPRRRFTVGIIDDVGGSSLPFDEGFETEPEDVSRAVFFGLGADGTVSANKNSIKIIGKKTGRFVQGYFVYDSKKSGAMTVSHLRFGPRPIRSPYLIRRAPFVAVHHLPFLDRVDVLSYAAPGATLLLNARGSAEQAWRELSLETQREIIDKKLKVYAIDAYRLAREAGLGRRINTIMQACFFSLSGLLLVEEALASMKEAIQASYGKKGADIVERNRAAIDLAVSRLERVKVPAEARARRQRPPIVPDGAPDFVKGVTAVMLAGKGDRLPVSAFSPDGTWPTATSRWEKRAVAEAIPIWEQGLCIQCNKCALVCPHAAIRPKTCEPGRLAAAPEGFKSADFKAVGAPRKYVLQVAPEDCTGCGLCVEVCPAKAKEGAERRAIELKPLAEHLERERKGFAFFLGLPEAERSEVKRDVKGSQFLRPLLEFSGACTGCGETPYIKLLTQFVGDRLLVANATGCSSIYGGNLPTTPYCVDEEGRGPAWSNSLFEDNAEFGLGLRLGSDVQEERARRLLKELSAQVGPELASALLESRQESEADVAAQRKRVAQLGQALSALKGEAARELEEARDGLVGKSVWIIGGDGWAYDIGFGGLDHILASGNNLKILVLDTEVYSNTGGQQSKATPLAATAKFAAGGKGTAKKDLGLIAMSYGNVYVARVALGASDTQTVKALLEAQAYPGTSLVIAYSPCIAHGYDISAGLAHQKLAVDTGMWPLYRFDPRRRQSGLPELQLDSKPKLPVREYLRQEGRFRLADAAVVQAEVDRRFAAYQKLAGVQAEAAKSVKA